MSIARIGLLVLGLLALPLTCAGQLSIPLSPLKVDDDPPIAQTPAYSQFSDVECDSDRTIYLRRESDDDNSWDIAKVSPDGSAEQMQLAAVPGFGEMHTFAIAVDDGGSVHEIVRAWPTETGDDSPLIYYLLFAPDGSFRSRQRLQKEFIPAVLVPLPSGNFFSAGVVVKKTPGSRDLEESPLAAIFDSDAQPIARLGSGPARLKQVSTGAQDDQEDDATAIQQGGSVRLGDDGNLYVLLSHDKTRVRVFAQTGEFLYELNLEQPFRNGLATGLWVSAGRLLVRYEGEADDPANGIVFMLYDSHTGELIRAYHPEFSGTVACFQDGTSLSVLLQNKSTGKFALGTAELQ